MAQGNEIAVVIEVNEFLARAALLLAGEVGKLRPDSAITSRRFVSRASLSVGYI
jgi:hypothetical protein